MLLAGSSEATVWTVSPPGGGGQFPTIQAAVDAASPGDTVRVKAGSYPPFVLDKTLRVLGVGPSLVTVTAPSAPPATGAVAVAITAIPATGFAMVAGMKVVVADCCPTTCNAVFGSLPNHAVTVTGASAPVVLSNLDINPGHNGRGIKADLSQLLILDHVVVAAAPWGCGGISPHR
ncbi:MAG: hypothetical protein ACREIU_00810 [Planctomycetota bacterium]